MVEVQAELIPDQHFNLLSQIQVVAFMTIITLKEMTIKQGKLLQMLIGNQNKQAHKQNITEDKCMKTQSHSGNEI